MDFFRSKIRPASNKVGGAIFNRSNPDIHSFVEQNSTSLWGKNDVENHVAYNYDKPEDLGGVKK